MITGIRTRKIVSLPDVKTVLEKLNIPETREVMEILNNLPRKRVKAPPPPVGSISVHAAGIKYNIHPSTIHKWIKKGIIPVIKLTINSKYIDESSLTKLLKLDRNKRHIFVENFNK